MNKYWHMVVVGALLEVIWVTGLAHADSILTWAVTIVSVILSYALFTVAAKGLPMGSLYAIYTGLGTLGTILVGVFIFNESMSFIKGILMITLCIGMIGLRIIEGKEGK